MPAQLPSPRNSLGPPAGMHRKKEGAYANRLVLARLVWRDRTEVVPARLTWVCEDRVRVEWWWRGGRRESWLPRGDVAGSLRW